jgi:hypothetical protein
MIDGYPEIGLVQRHHQQWRQQQLQQNTALSRPSQLSSMCPRGDILGGYTHTYSTLPPAYLPICLPYLFA